MRSWSGGRAGARSSKRVVEDGRQYARPDGEGDSALPARTFKPHPTSGQPVQPLIARRPLLTLMIAVAIGVGTTATLQNLPHKAIRLKLTPVVQAVLGDSGAPAVGSSNPNVTVVEFTDYQCPVCRADDPALERLLSSDRKVRVIFKDWPIFGPNSKLAARAVLAANLQGKYLTLHRALMTSRGTLDAANIHRIAGAAGLDVDRLERDEATHQVQFDRQLARHATQAWTLGLPGTPAYLVGASLFEGGLDDQRLADAVARARKDGPPA